MQMDAGFTIAVLTKNRTNPAYVGARAGADRVAAAHRGRVRHYVPDVPDDVAQQIGLIAAAVRDRPDAIILIPTHPTAVLPAIRQIHAAGIPLFTLVSRAVDDGVVCHVGSDDAQLADAISTYLFDRLDGGGDVLFVGGHPNSTTSPDRERGFRAAVDRHPGIRVAGIRRGDYQWEPARLAVLAALDAGGSLDGVVAANDLMALGILAALAERDRRLPVVGVNAIPEGVRAIKDGRLLATAAFDAMSMACLATEAAIRHLRGELVPKEIMLPVDIVDRGNCGRWDVPYEERNCPSWTEILG